MRLDLTKLGTDNPPITFLREYKSQRVQWIGNDTIELYQENCKDIKVREYIQQWDQSLWYNLNSEGYRTSEIVENKNSIVALGCSHTFGVGLPEKDVYCSVLAKMLDMPLYNLGVPGGASDTAFRIASYWLPVIKPKYVVMVGPQYTRFEIRIAPQDQHVFVPGNLDADDIVQQMVKRYLVNDENPVFNRQKNLLAIENIANKFGAEFFAYSERNFHVTDRARDNLHYGPQSHLNLATRIYADITGKSPDRLDV